jgi:hypothetical protein
MTKQPSFANSTPFSHLLGRKALFLWIREFLEKNDVDGFFIEFGVFQGESLKEAYYCLRDQVSDYVGLDSFQGLPEPEEVDALGVTLTPAFVKGNYASYGIDFVKNNILSTGIDPEKVLLIEGYFEDSLTPLLKRQLLGLGSGKASVIHLDVDIYSSTIQALKFAYDFMQTGCWLLCDDYWCYQGASQFGTQKALREFLESHPEIRLQEYSSYQGWSKAFIVERLS